MKLDSDISLKKQIQIINDKSFFTITLSGTILFYQPYLQILSKKMFIFEVV